MLGSVPVMAFVPPADLDRSRRFYEGTLGLAVTEVTPFACVLRAGGTVPRIAKTRRPPAAAFTVLGWTVPDIRHVGRSLATRDVEFTRYPGMGQDSDGIWTTTGGDLVAWFTGPDGNTLSLTQFNMSQPSEK